jgi:hypothetical protein
MAPFEAFDKKSALPLAATILAEAQASMQKPAAKMISSIERSSALSIHIVLQLQTLENIFSFKDLP